MQGTERGQSGLDRLMLFVVALIVIVFATPYLLGLGGVDVRGTATPAATPTPTPNGTAEPVGLVVLNASGETGGFGSETVGVVRLVVTRNGSGQPVDTTAVTANWADLNNTYTLTARGTGGSAADGEFDVAVEGPSGSDTTLTETGDRAILTFDLGTDDVDGVDEFGHRLLPGETVTFTMTTGGGKTTRLTLTVPDDTERRGTVTLRR